jgi:hypothetical protein
VFVLVLVFALGCTRVPPTGTPVVQPTVTASARPGPKVSPSPSVLPSPTEGTALLPGRLVVQTTPAQAQVVLDGQAIGQSPLEVEVPPGKHHLAVALEQHEPWERTVEVAEAQALTIEIRLQFRALGLLVETNVEPPSEIKTLQWHSNERLVYAVGLEASKPRGVRPYEWTWWSFDIGTGDKTPYSSTLTPLDDSVLEELGIFSEEGAFSVSSENACIIYTRFDECQRDFCPEETKFWCLADCPVWATHTTWTEPVLLGIIPIPGIQAFFSPRSKWAVIVSWPEGNPAEFWVARTDGTFLGSFDDLAGVETGSGCASPPISPVFSPDGRWVAVEADSRIAGCVCGFWVVNLEEKDAFELGGGMPCMEGIGRVQWSSDSKHLYWLKGDTLLKLSVQERFANPAILAGDIPHSAIADVIAVSPDETMIALANLGSDADVIIVQFAPR